MRHLLCLIVFFFSYTMYGQCDVSISSWNAASGDITIEAIDSENCGCNDFTTEGKSIAGL